MSDVTLPKLDWRIVFNRASPPGYTGWGRVRAAQLTDMARAVSAAARGQAFNAVLLILILAGTIAPSVLALWLLAPTLLMTRAFTFLQPVPHMILPSLPRRPTTRAGNTP